MRVPAFLRPVPVVLAAAVTACGGSTEPTSPAARAFVGDYAASQASAEAPSYGALTFTATAAGTTTDQLARGAQVRVRLSADGTTAGRLVVPGSGSEPGIDADLSGTWSRTGTTVRLQHAADTFLRDMPLTLDGSQLKGDATFSGVRVRVVVQRR